MFFVNKQLWCHFGKRTQCGTVLPEMLTELFVRSYFQHNKLLIYFFSFLWHKVIVLISNMFIYAKIGNSKFVEMHAIASDIYPSALVFYTRHRLILRSIELFIYIQTCVNVNAFQIKKIWTTVASLHCCNLIWGLANNNYSLYFLQFLMGTVAIYVCAIFSFPSYIVILYIVGPLSKLTETSFFCWRLHKYDLLQFVVMDHSTVIFQKEKGGGGKYITYKKNHWYARLQ